MGANNARLTVKVTVSCGHTAELMLPIPDFGSSCYCHVCGEWGDVTEVPDRWEVRCKARRNCVRELRKSESTALRFAESHAKRTRHTIEVRHGGLAVHRWEQDGGWYQPWHPSLELGRKPV